MKDAHKNKAIIKMFCAFAVFSFIALNDCAGLESEPEYKTTGIKAGKETLVQRDVVNDYPIWCGSGAALVYQAWGKGIFWHDIETGEKVEITGWPSWPRACTPDGKWIIYTEGYRADGYDDETIGEVEHGTWAGDEELEYDLESAFIPYEGPDPVKEVWRYEIETGRRQKIAVVFETEERGIGIDDSSPEGIKIYLGQETATKVKMPEPKWEIVWSLKKHGNMDVWLKDFSAVLGTYLQSLPRVGFYDMTMEVLEIEVFSPHRKVFIVYPVTEVQTMYLLLVDSKGRVFIRRNWERMEDEWQGQFVDRCSLDIDKEAISCTPVLEIKDGDQGADSPCPQCPVSPVPTGRYLGSLDIFSDDETMVFTVEGGECVWIMKIGEKEAGCLTGSGYEIGGSVTISHDERWIAFTVDRRTGEGEIKTIQNYTQDLYAVRVE